jgi:hypothetical protein
VVDPEKIESLARRILYAMEAFKPGARSPDSMNDAIGLYDAGEDTEPLWVTTAGVVRAGEGAVLRYDSMVEVHAPTSKTRDEPESSRLVLMMEDGTRETIVVAGGRGRFCDSFEFSRFLSRAARLSRS